MSMARRVGGVDMIAGGNSCPATKDFFSRMLKLLILLPVVMRILTSLVLLAFNWEIAIAQTSTNSFLNFETAPVHPIAISPDHSTLAALNLPDGRLELFDLQGDHPSPIGAISVGVDPVSVRFRTATEIWVVNSISDSISIIELPHLRVAATLATGDGPADVVFAGNQQRAFVSCPPTNVVQVFDPLSAARPLIRTIPIDGDRPKAMAAS